jgi:hypothetical protein
VNADTLIKGRMALYCIDEAYHLGGVDNMLAVAFVLRNRVAAGWQGGDWMAVLDQADEVAGKKREIARGVDLRDGSIRQFLSAVDDIYIGSKADDLTNEALFYAELHTLTNDWFRENVVRKPENHPRVATVGMTAFFR